MNRYDRADGRRACRWTIQYLGQFAGVHCVIVGLDVDQHGCCTDHLDRSDGGDRCMRHRHHAHTRPDAQRAQCQRQRVGAIAAADRGRRTQPGGELSLERTHLLAKDVPPGLQNTCHGGIDLRLQGAIARAGIGLRDEDRRLAHRHCLNVDRLRCSEPGVDRRRRTGTHRPEPTLRDRHRTAA